MVISKKADVVAPGLKYGEKKTIAPGITNFKTFFIPLFQTMNVAVLGRIIVSRGLPLVSLVEFVKN